MVRTVAPLPKVAKGETLFLLPGADSPSDTPGAWQLFRFGAAGIACLQPNLDIATNRWAAQSVLALPAREVFCVALWLSPAVPADLPGMIELQLELRKLQGRAGPSVFAYSVVAKEEARQLVCVGVLTEELPPAYQAERYAGFDLAARYRPLAPDTLTLWREQGQLALAVTRGPELAYFQALGANTLGPPVIQELLCLRDMLGLQEIAPRITQLDLWIEADPPERQALGAALGLPVRAVTPPTPRRPAQTWDLVPRPIEQARKTRQTRSSRQRSTAFIAAALLIVLAGLLGRLGWTYQQVTTLVQWQTEKAPALALVQQSRTVWRDLAPVVDPARYPLENLLHTAAALPPDGLRLTLYDEEGNQIRLRGEAKDASLAFQFFDALKKSADFPGVTWQMSPPSILPNDLTQLEIVGTR